MSRRVAVSLLLAFAAPASAVELVKDGRPAVTIVADAPPAPKAAPKGGKKRAPEAAAGGEAQAVRLLVEWVKKITDAELPVADKARRRAGDLRRQGRGAGRAEARRHRQPDEGRRADRRRGRTAS